MEYLGRQSCDIQKNVVASEVFLHIYRGFLHVNVLRVSCL